MVTYIGDYTLGEEGVPRYIKDFGKRPKLLLRPRD